jgi:diaminopimelate epimerase
MRFAKYHGLGNDYLVLDPTEVGGELSEDHVRLICDRHFGVGADGILLGPLPDAVGRFSLSIFNPDGSQAAKSGNGLRIFARYLYDRGLAGTAPFEIATRGGLVRCQVHGDGRGVTVDMGQVSFRSEDIPLLGPARDALNEEITAGGRTFRYCAATIGNPHCVLLDAPVTKEAACLYGPAVERDPRFPDRTNVQFLQVLDRGSIRIEIWERGAGYTLASGSSSCAAAAVAHRLGLCDDRIVVHMPGGELAIIIGHDYAITMTGPVVKVCEGQMTAEMFPATGDAP